VHRRNPHELPVACHMVSTGLSPLEPTTHSANRSTPTSTSLACSHLLPQCEPSSSAPVHRHQHGHEHSGELILRAPRFRPTYSVRVIYDSEVVDRIANLAATPLTIATEVIPLLLAHGANKDAMTLRGHTPFGWFKKGQSLSFIVSSGANP